MKIERFAQSGCVVTSSQNTRLAIDVGALTPVETLADVRADFMLVSHVHADHFSLPQIETLNPQRLYIGAECAAELTDTAFSVECIEAGKSYRIADFSVEVFMVDHGPNAPRVPEQNFGFLISDGDESLYFAGDMYSVSGIDVTKQSVDYALLPVGGHFTFDAEAAYDFAKQFKHIGTVLPMHYEAVGPIDVTAGETFKRLAAADFAIVA